MRAQKGITLVALIITIIVLLILAVVTIASVTGDNIIQKSREAKEMYKNASDVENAKLSEYENIMLEYTTNNTVDGSENTLDGSENTLDGSDNTLDGSDNTLDGNDTTDGNETAE